LIKTIKEKSRCANGEATSIQKGVPGKERDDQNTVTPKVYELTPTGAEYSKKNGNFSVFSQGKEHEQVVCRGK